MKRIAVFYHCLFYLPDRKLDGATKIVLDQMMALKQSGLLDAATKFVVGVNGGEESEILVKLCIPEKAEVIYHGLDSRNENSTIMALWNWVQALPPTEDWAILYHHSKSATHPPNSDYAAFANRWRESMQKICVTNWQRSVADLRENDVSCTYWLWNQADGTQHIPAGNFLWTKASFVRQLPSMFHRQRIKDDGIAALSSRYEAEVFWGFGPRPLVKTYGTQGLGGIE